MTQIHLEHLPDQLTMLKSEFTDSFGSTSNRSINVNRRLGSGFSFNLYFTQNRPVLTTAIFQRHPKLEANSQRSPNG